MAKKLTIVANGIAFSAYPGEVLLDSALHQGINLPHDCRAGQCGSCRVRVLDGDLLGGETAQRGVVHACQARVFSNVTLRFEKMPSVRKLAGELVRIDRLSADVRGLTIKLREPAHHRPGQYYRLKFRGFPSRCFSPTSAFAGGGHKRILRLHVKIVRDGTVSSRLETDIQPGHKLSVEGPYGSAFFRPREGGRLVLVAGGTGFAPIWAIAEAAMRTQPQRPMLVIAGARRLSSLYMAPALYRLAVHPTTDIIATTEEAQSVSRIVRSGTPAEHLPTVSASDVIYAAGAPSMVEAVGSAAARAGAAFYADPFFPSGRPEPAWMAAQRARLGIDNLASHFRSWLEKLATQRSRNMRDSWSVIGLKR
jgi:3-phenylpropionate/trans-cinnamate dioxygenase ferredoxin reductase subunit